MISLGNAAYMTAWLWSLRPP